MYANYKVYTSTLKPTNIQSSFRKSDIYPFEPEVNPEAAVAPSNVFCPKVLTTQNIQMDTVSSASLVNVFPAGQSLAS